MIVFAVIERCSALQVVALIINGFINQSIDVIHDFGAVLSLDVIFVTEPNNMPLFACTSNQFEILLVVSTLVASLEG